MNRIYPELIYVCPLTKDTFVTKDYCEKTQASIRINQPRACPHYKGTQKDGLGSSVIFDVILCNYQSSTPIASDKE